MNLPNIGIINLIIGIYLIANALLMKTPNVVSSIWFKMIPFFSGLFLFLSGLYLMGAIKL